MEQEKDIADLRRQLAAISGDNSSAARAKRAQLEAELAEANAALEDSYYERSISNRQDALDKELESFQEEKDKEIEGWEEYLENTELVVSDALATVQSNTDIVLQTLKETGKEYDLTMSDALVSPWKDGALAIQEYSETFGASMSSTMEKLDEMQKKAEGLTATIEDNGKSAVDSVTDNFTDYTTVPAKEPAKTETTTKKKETKKEETKKPSLTKGSYVEVKSGTKWYADSYGGGKSGKAKSGKIKYINTKGSHPYNIDGLGWVRKKDIKGYKTGTTGVKKDQLAWVDENQLEELVLGIQDGRLTYLTKGSAVVPHDLTTNLMSWGELDPQDMLDRNRPSIAPNKNIVNTEINLDCSVGELVHIDHCDQNTLPDVEKIVNKTFEKHMQNLNNSLKRFTR